MKTKKIKKIHHEVQLFDKSTQKVFYDKLTYIYLEMPKFNKSEEELETHFDKWMYIIKNLEFLPDRPGRIQERIFQKLFKQVEIANYSVAEYTDYSESLKKTPLTPLLMTAKLKELQVAWPEVLPKVESKVKLKG